MNTPHRPRPLTDEPRGEFDEIVEIARDMKRHERWKAERGEPANEEVLAYLAYLVETDVIEPRECVREDPLFFEEWKKAR